MNNYLRHLFHRAVKIIQVQQSASLHLYYAGNKQQYHEQQPCRGYQSTVDARAHFGLGAATAIDSLRVQWQDGKSQLLSNIKADQELTISYRNASRPNNPALQPEPVLFTDVAARYGIEYLHQENEFVDYNAQPALPHKLSQYGPGIAVGDIDKNGYDDFYIGGSAGKKGVFFMQDAGGNFAADSNRIINQDTHPQEDMVVLFFDADNDNDLDLYAVNGSYELPDKNPENCNRLYINNGKGKFQLSTTALPRITSNGSCVRAADFDGDGDLDLFIGGRVVASAYPLPPRSYILKNHGGKFTDVTSQYCPQLANMGMITDALWSDYDNDGKIDLVLAGEWMPVTFLKNTGKAFSINKNTGAVQHTACPERLFCCWRCKRHGKNSYGKE